MSKGKDKAIEPDRGDPIQWLPDKPVITEHDELMQRDIEK